MPTALQPVAAPFHQQRFAEQLLAQPKEQSVELIVPDGLLNQRRAGEGVGCWDDRAPRL
jgi:hypothetical protein